MKLMGTFDVQVRIGCARTFYYNNVNDCAAGQFSTLKYKPMKQISVLYDLTYMLIRANMI